MMFVENALEGMRGRYLRGYGEISAEAERLLDGAVSEMQAQVREIEGFLTGASADVLRTYLDSLAPGDPIADLARADITPFAWVVNQSLTPLDVTDPVLRAGRSHEAVHLRELAAHGKRTALEPWHADILAADPVGA
jgi:hypothetical protein